MPKLTLKNSGKSFPAIEGEEIMDLCDREGAEIPFGCRAGICGTCRIRVVENPQNLLPMEELEVDFLKNFVTKAHPNDRLACQCQIQGDVTIELIDSGNHHETGDETS